MRLWLAAVLTVGTLTVPPANEPASAPPGDTRQGLAGEEFGAGRQADFAAAAREFGVPVSVLLGVAYLGSRWDAHPGRPSTAGGYGPMHLVDAVPAAERKSAHLIGDALGDARGDDARPMPPLPSPPSVSALRASQPPTTLPEAGRLIGVDPARLRGDPVANIRAGAALLASYQKRPSPDPADWHAAIARFSGAEDLVAARAFADEVFAVIQEGMARRTDDGHLVRLAPVPNLRRPRPDDEQAAAELETKSSMDGENPGQTAERQPVPEPPSHAEAGPYAGEEIAAQDLTTDLTTVGPPLAQDEVHAAQTESLGQAAAGQTYAEQATAEQTHAEQAAAEQAAAGGQAECPSSLACEWMPAAYKRFSSAGSRGKKSTSQNDKDDYGNHDRLIRSRDVDYIVIHDTEGTYQGIPSMIRNPRYVSWHYTIRSRDGHVAQHVATKDIAWHAGNWDVNTRSVGIEHEGYLARGGTWYTEAMYRASAKLVRYLADRHAVPLNRAHILGHDNVPGTTPKTVAGMHEDPGPYWDWAHYFELLQRPLRGVKDGNSVMIRPRYGTHRPRFTGCVTTKSAKACPSHGAATVWLHTAPSESAPLVRDVGKHGGKPSTYSVYDHAARASTGQRFAVAARQGDWTAIWYLGQKAWFHNPPSNPTAVPAKSTLVTPQRPDTKVYGRAYPEKSAYVQAAYQPLTPLPYRIDPGQTYTVGDTVTGSYYATGAFNPAKHVTTTGSIRYYQIQLGHRVMFVMARDVRVIS